jgi:hypothetical protein
MEIWFLIAVVAGLLYCFLGRKEPTPSPHARLRIAPPDSVPQPAEDRFADEAAAVRDKWDDELQTIDAQHHEGLELMLSKLAKARELINTSGVGDGACDILRIMWHWPSWSQNDGWKMPLSVTGLGGGDELLDDPLNETKEGRG